MKQSKAVLNYRGLALFSLLTLGGLNPDLAAQSANSSDSGSEKSEPANPVYLANTMLKDYLELIEQGNLESAELYWLPSARQRAGRLGITYNDIPIKADLNSPVMKSAKMNPDIEPKIGLKRENGFFTLGVSAKRGGEPVNYQYHAVEQDGYVWLTFAQDYVAHDWREVESKFFRFHISPHRSRYFNRIAVASLDRYVDSIGHELGINRARMKHLAREKFDYYFCADDAELKRITGVAVPGLHDLASDAIITSVFPHYHEVAHALVSYRLQNLPLTTLPFLREGLATYLGGRAYRAPSSLLDMAAYLFRYEVVSVDSLLELMAFHGDHDASIAYSGSALFINLLVDRFGFDRVMDLYLGLSGDFAKTAAIRSEDVRREALKHFSVSWDKLLTDFAENYISGDFSQTDDYPHLRPETEWPENPGRPGSRDRPKASASLPGAEISIIGQRVFVRGLPNGSGAPKGTVFLGAGRDMELLASDLFEEQFEKRPFPGRRFSIRFDRREAGLYDYATSTLVAKYISSFDPQSAYFNDEDTTVSFSFPYSLCDESSSLLDDPIYIEE